MFCCLAFLALRKHAGIHGKDGKDKKAIPLYITLNNRTFLKTFHSNYICFYNCFRVLFIFQLISFFLRFFSYFFTNSA